MNSVKLLSFMLIIYLSMNAAVAENISVERGIKMTRDKESFNQLIECYPKFKYCPLPFI